uniref:Protein K-12 n=1 Tax=Macaca fascicularis TaxID=9541 RepID=A0A7N9CL76_MACFA
PRPHLPACPLGSSGGCGPPATPPCTGSSRPPRPTFNPPGVSVRSQPRCILEPSTRTPSPAPTGWAPPPGLARPAPPQGPQDARRSGPQVQDPLRGSWGSLLCSARFCERASDPPAAPLALPAHPGHLGPPRSPLPAPRSPAAAPRPAQLAQCTDSRQLRAEPTCPRATRAARAGPARRELSWKHAPGRFPAAFSVNRGCGASRENSKFPVTLAANAGCSRNSAASRKPRSFLFGGWVRRGSAASSPAPPSRLFHFPGAPGPGEAASRRSASRSGPGWDSPICTEGVVSVSRGENTVMTCNISNAFSHVIIKLRAQGQESTIFNEVAPGYFSRDGWQLQVQGGVAQLVIKGTRDSHAGLYTWHLVGRQRNNRQVTLEVSGAEPQSTPDAGSWPVPVVVTAVFILLVLTVMFAWYRCRCSQQRREVGGPAPQCVWVGGLGWGRPRLSSALLSCTCRGSRRGWGAPVPESPSPLGAQLAVVKNTQPGSPDPPCPPCKPSLSPGLPGGQHGRACGLHQGHNLEFPSQGNLLLRAPCEVGSTSSGLKTKVRAGGVWKGCVL